VEQVFAIADAVRPWLRAFVPSRMGHNGTRAALIYQHASRDRDRAIAAAVSARIEAARPEGK
jgi:hypothetical protein